MAFTAEQHNFTGEPARLFLMKATRSGLPVDVLHVYRDGAARMRVRLLSMLPIVDASGPDMTRAETVTLLNDIALLAPGALADPAIAWREVDAHTAEATFTEAGVTVRAVLTFDGAGLLVDFVSDNRLAASPDGERFTPLRWSTPVGEYRDYGPMRAASRGSGVWHAAGGSWAYIELELLELEVDAGR